MDDIRNYCQNFHAQGEEAVAIIILYTYIIYKIYNYNFYTHIIIK